jgi:MFS family permease
MRLPALRHARFNEYLAGTFVSNIGSSIQAWAIAWHVYALTGSSLMVGLLGLVRVGPLLTFTLLGGVLADQADRRRVMLVTQSGMALVSVGLFAATLGEARSIELLYLFVGLHSVARAFDGPARQSLFANLVPAADFPNAASLNGISWRLSDVLGPIFAGLLIQSGGLAEISGLGLCYAMNALTFSAVLWAVWRMPASPPKEMGDRARSLADVRRRIGEGFAFVRRTPVVRQAMWIDFWATLLSGADALIPAFATSILKLDAQGFGFLAASSGAGALLAAGGLAWFPTVQRQGRLVVLMIGTYGLFTIGFGFSQSLWTAAFCLACVGASDMISTVMRQTIRQLATPDAMRGRMNATSSLFHISGPQLGDFEAGAVASAAGERFSIVLGGSLCFFVALHYGRAKALLGYEHEKPPAKDNG